MATAATVALSACSLGGDERSLAGVVKETRASRSARIATTLSIAGEGAQDGSGVADFASRRARMTYENSELGAPPGTMVVAGEAGYVRLGGSRRWIKSTRAEATPFYGDPVGWISALADAEDVEEVEQAHYRGRADEITFDVWLDAEGRARRIRYRDQTGAFVTIEYSDFGLPVDIVVPAKGVMTVEQHQRFLRRQLNGGCQNEPVMCEVLGFSKPERSTRPESMESP